jgi:hypothetical protein
MSNWPVMAGCGVTPVLNTDLANTRFNSVSVSTANTKSSWGQLVASLAHSIQGFWLHLDYRDSIFNCLLDIGVGAGGAEKVILSNMLFPQGNTYLGSAFWIPLRVARGSRVAARWQNSSGFSAVGVGISVPKSNWRGPRGFSRGVCEGVSTSTSKGKSLDSGGTSHTMGSWVEVVASTATPTRAISVHISPDSSQQNAGRAVIEIGDGDSGSERTMLTITDGWGGFVKGSEYKHHGPYLLSLPSGVRLAARHQASTTNTSSIRALHLGVTRFY